MKAVKVFFILCAAIYLSACRQDTSATMYRELKKQNAEAGKDNYCSMMRILGMRCDNEFKGIPLSCRLLASPHGDSVYIIDISRYGTLQLVQWRQLPIHGLRFDSLVNNEYNGITWKTYMKAVDTDLLVPIKKQLDSLNFWAMQCPDSALGPGFEPGKGKYELIAAHNHQRNAVVRYSLGSPLDSVYNRILRLADLH